MGQRISIYGSSEEMVLAGADETNLISTGESCKEMVSTGGGETNFISTDGTAHQFKVNYLKMKDLSNGQGIASPIFKSGGHKWIIHCYPKGSSKDEDNDNVAVFLELLSDCAKLYVNFIVTILGKSGSKPLQMTSSQTFTNASYMCGWRRFTKRIDLEERYVTDEGYFQILCSINAINQECDWASRFPVGQVKEDISKLWETGEMADVKFEIEGEIICAHKVILAARSSAFKAELKSHMAEGKMGCIRIEDMKPEVFRALLRFIYDNSLDNERETHEATSVMTRHLLAAAVRYAIEGLIVRCADYLMENLSFDTVMDVLILADRHCLFKLKEACLEFVSIQENFTKISLTDDYIHMALAYAPLWSELEKKRPSKLQR